MLKKAIALLLVVAAIGCGGSSNSNNGRRIELVLRSSAIDDLELVVSPDRGSVNSSNACREDDENFGCNVSRIGDEIRITFRSDNDADNDPFYVYVRNFSGSRRTFDFRSYVDGRTDAGGTTEVFGNEDLLIARVFSDSVELADLPGQARKFTLIKK